MPKHSIVIREGVDRDKVARRYGITPEQLVDSINGFAVELSAAQARRLSQDPDVVAAQEAVEPTLDALALQTNPAFGLDRLDEGTGTLPPDRKYQYSRDGVGVTIYVLDTTWVDITHTEFSDLQATQAFRSPSDRVVGSHSTKVASCAVGKVAGVARRSVLKSVATQTNVDYAIGADWIIADHQAHGGPSVCVAPIGWAQTMEDVNTATQAMIDAGIIFVTSAGNDGVSGDLYSPNQVAAGIVVGYIDQYNTWLSGSTNYGPTVDVYATGAQVRAATTDVPASNNTVWAPGYSDTTGSSFSAPYVAGVCALILQGEPTLTPAQVHQRIIDDSAKNAITGIPVGSNNRIATIPTYLREAGSIHSTPVSSTISVTAGTPPVAVAFAVPTTVDDPLDVISLDGTDSSDPDGVIVSYQWELVSAPEGYTGTFSAPTSSTTTFTPTETP